MPERTNTTPLIVESAEPRYDDHRSTMVEVSHVSMVFNMASERLNSLKEYLIALTRRELRFKEFRALDDISFKVKKGDVFGILGTNGSGKSTMLKIIAGVLEPSEGACSISGNIAPLIELGAGFDFELTAQENIYLNGALLGYSRKFIDQHFDEIVAFAEVDEFLEMPMKNYSSGMVARIAFAIATVIVPEILIVDEVLSVGDFMFQQKCERRITQLIKEHDVTVLIVSHNNDQIERLCNEAIWIEKGHTRMKGSAQEVCRAYRILGGHTGSPESEERVYQMLNEKVKVPVSLIDSISGESRFGTAVKLMEKARLDHSDTVIISSGELASACIGATGLSGMLDAPVLLSKPNSLPDVTTQALKHIKPAHAIIVGDETITSPQVSADILEACETGTNVMRLYGSTAAQLSWEIYELGEKLGSWGDTAFVTYDSCIADLVSFSPYLFAKKAPVFFIIEDGLIDGRVEKLLKSGAFSHLLVLGGTQHVSDSFLGECEQNGVTSERIVGDGPYQANEAINDWIASQPTSLDKIEKLVVASAWNPFDALAGGAYTHKTQAAFLLEDPQDLNSVSHALSYIERMHGAIRHLTFLGDHVKFNDLDQEILGKAVELARKGHRL